MKREQGEKAFAARAAAGGLSKSQLAEAKLAGVDIKDPVAITAYRATINTRSDSRNSPPRPPSNEESVTMTIEDIELALTQKGVTPNEARALKTQLEGLKVAMALKQQRNLLLSREEIDDRDSRIMHALQGMFRLMENEIPALCYGLNTLGEMKDVVKKKIRAAQNLYADESSDFWRKYPET